MTFHEKGLVARALGMTLLIAGGGLGCDLPPGLPAAGGTGGVGVVGGTGGMGVAGASGGSDGNGGNRQPPPGELAAKRDACSFHAGAMPADTIEIPSGWPSTLPITHIIVVVQENHSFDNYFGRLSATLQPDAEPLPPAFANMDASGNRVAPQKLTSSCLNLDPPHQWNDAHLAWNNGQMDGFARNGGPSSLTYYDESEMPFYFWLASTFTIADRHFAPVLAGTWANRDYLYAGTSRGVQNSFSRTIPDIPTIFDQLSTAGVSWGVYTDGEPFQDTLGWDNKHSGVSSFEQFLSQAADGSLPRVSFVDPPAFSDQDEHPSGVADLSKGQAWTRSVYEAVAGSRLWRESALFVTWDEWGGFFDHVNPPAACTPSADQPDYNQLGFRVALVLASPWARRHAVSHVVHSHTSIDRFIQLVYGIPALTDRDANSDALLDMFDFTQPNLLSPPPAPPVAIPPCMP
jgi:phospholipase C